MKSNKPVISLNNVGKCYRIFSRPQDRFKQAIREQFNIYNNKGTNVPLYQEHWALRGVDLEIYPGESVGILGRNGAGKSTLLQIIAGTLSPTIGEIQTFGRITALLELGSGFNPEFTGRENVFHNAQILGLTREEIKNKYDDIAAFADIGKFIDQPVKTYSSGMMMRLAFAVQTAVEPKILIVDEALSVGDMFFQSKCMRRLGNLVNDGTTLLFVSHDIATIRQFCTQAVLIGNGQIKAIGNTNQVTDIYKNEELLERSADTVEEVGSETEEQTENFLIDVFSERANKTRFGNGEAKVLDMWIELNGNPGIRRDYFEFGDIVNVKLKIHCRKNINNLNVAIKFRTVAGVDFAYFDNRLAGNIQVKIVEGNLYLLTYTVRLSLQHGSYIISSWLETAPVGEERDWTFIDIIHDAAEFIIAPRAEGMIAGLTTWDFDFNMEKVA